MVINVSTKQHCSVIYKLGQTRFIHRFIQDGSIVETCLIASDGTTWGFSEIATIKHDKNTTPFEVFEAMGYRTENMKQVKFYV